MSLQLPSPTATTIPLVTSMAISTSMIMITQTVMRTEWTTNTEWTTTTVDSTSTPNPSGPVDTGKIVGGAIAGSVALLLMFSALFLWILRRSRRRRQREIIPFMEKREDPVAPQQAVWRSISTQKRPPRGRIYPVRRSESIYEQSSPLLIEDAVQDALCSTITVHESDRVESDTTAVSQSELMKPSTSRDQGGMRLDNPQDRRQELSRAILERQQSLASLQAQSTISSGTQGAEGRAAVQALIGQMESVQEEIRRLRREFLMSHCALPSPPPAY